MKFQIEQIAICPRDRDRALWLLQALGAYEWAHDHVVALGRVFGIQSRNEADLAFNYALGRQDKPLEFEVLNYTHGPNWMATRACGVSHLGMHCTHEDLIKWRSFFTSLNIAVAQEVVTESHTNPVIAGLRRYNYVIFNTWPILGVDLKFIVRLNPDGSVMQ